MRLISFLIFLIIPQIFLYSTITKIKIISIEKLITSYTFILVGNDYLSSDKVFRFEKNIIDDLLLEVEKKEFFEPVFDSNRYNEEWFKVNSKKVFNLIFSGRIAQIEELKEIFYNYFMNPKIFFQYYESELSLWRKDYWTKFEILFYENDSLYLSLSSTVHNQFMLPWTIKKGQEEYISYNQKINDELVKIVPSFINHYKQINGSEFLNNIAWRMNWEIHNEYGSLIASLVYKNEINQISNIFDIVESKRIIRTYLDEDSVTAGWKVKLKQSHFPENFLIKAYFTEDEKHNISVKTFLEMYEFYYNQVINSKFIFKLISKNHNINCELLFADSLSLNEFAFNNFNFLTKKEEKVLSKIDDIENCSYVKIIENENNYSYWIIRPNQDCILWDYSGNKISYLENELINRSELPLVFEKD